MNNSAYRSSVLSLYRHIYRQCSITFANDPLTIDKSHHELRKQFQKKKLITDKKQIEEGIKHAQEAFEYLRTSVIQAVEKPNQKGHFEAKLRPEHAKPDT